MSLRLRTRTALNRQSTELILEKPGHPSLVLPLTTAEVQELLDRLVALRPEMSPPPSQQTAPQPTGPLRLEHAQWQVGLDAASGLPSFALLLPHREPVSMLLEPDAALTLAEQLRHVAGLAPQGPDTLN